MENIIKSFEFEIISQKLVFLNNFLKKIVDNFDIDENNRDAIAKLFSYFTGNLNECEKFGLSLNKGIMLIGGVGTGKSVLMQAIKAYTGQILRCNSFQYFQASEIIDIVNVSGVQYLENFSFRFNERKQPNPITCYIDDICSKNEIVKNYGTEINVIGQLISMRYIIFSRYDKLTHFTTNIYPSEMKNCYDERTIDRLIEMCNIVELPGGSRRK